ncbi:MAG: hypothetical protein MUD10_05475 [Candidatus Pacebacteria bacterium]|jgi:hypothetical protein|nr:hypothetical protein [Candidatus Paceibacterota bacterium]
MFEQIKGLPEEEKFKEDADIRKAYLLAMAVDLGVDSATARERIDAMFEMAGQLANIDYSRDVDDLERDDPETYKKIETIGKWFLPDDKTEFAYNIGVWCDINPILSI